nr:MAG TPA: hypothetical protein [Microviridae sp.]
MIYHESTCHSLSSRLSFYCCRLVCFYLWFLRLS